MNKWLSCGGLINLAQLCNTPQVDALIPLHKWFLSSLAFVPLQVAHSGNTYHTLLCTVFTWVRLDQCGEALGSPL